MIRLSVQKDGFAIKGLTAEQLNVLNFIIQGVNNHCYQEQDEDGNYISGENYIGMMPESDRNALSELNRGIKTAIDRL